MLPISFANTWMTNIERNPERALRNANDLFISLHRVEFVKRLPLYTVLCHLLGIMPLVTNYIQDSICT